jgi:hypothetical protein
MKAFLLAFISVYWRLFGLDWRLAQAPSASLWLIETVGPTGLKRLAFWLTHWRPQSSP